MAGCSMIADATNQDEIVDALILYTSLNGIEMSLAEATERAAAYLRSNPDDLIDIAVVAYQEDQVQGPPDIVLPQWGKSRIYKLRSVRDGTFRHLVFDDWFDRGCRLDGLVHDSTLLHFWTAFQQDPLELSHLPIDSQAGISLSSYLSPGLRLRFVQVDNRIEVHHLKDGKLGELPNTITDELLRLENTGLRFLPLIDSVYEQQDMFVCKLMVTLAGPGLDKTALTAYARDAFFAARANC